MTMKKFGFPFIAGLCIAALAICGLTTGCYVENKTPDHTTVVTPSDKTVVVPDKKPDVVITPPSTGGTVTTGGGN